MPRARTRPRDARQRPRAESRCVTRAGRAHGPRASSPRRSSCRATRGDGPRKVGRSSGGLPPDAGARLLVEPGRQRPRRHQGRPRRLPYTIRYDLTASYPTYPYRMQYRAAGRCASASRRKRASTTGQSRRRRVRGRVRGPVEGRPRWMGSQPCRTRPRPMKPESRGRLRAQLLGARDQPRVLGAMVPT